MTIQYKHLGGIGINQHFAIKQDEKTVATLQRYGRSAWHLNAFPYGDTLGRYSNIERAREHAPAFHYPTWDEQYEIICKRVYAWRVIQKRGEFQKEIWEIANAMLKGSNSARERLAEINKIIEDYAADRTDQHGSYYEGAGSGSFHSRIAYPRDPEAMREWLKS